MGLEYTPRTGRVSRAVDVKTSGWFGKHLFTVWRWWPGRENEPRAVDVTKMLSHTVGLSGFSEALELVRQGKGLKVQVDPRV